MKLRKRAWQGREVPLEPESWSLFTSAGLGPRRSSSRASSCDRPGRHRGGADAAPARVLVALALNGVPIDVLAERLGTTRGALYKTLHDARRKLRRHLEERGSFARHRAGGDDLMKRPELKQALGRLLGPAEPEIGCDECFDQLDRYVELELAGRRDRRRDSRASEPTSTAAPPAARSTRACARSSAASRRCSRLRKNGARPRHQVGVTQMIFYGLTVVAAAGRVMRPRSASEQLVAAARRHVGDRPARVVDVGTGSGAIAIAIAAGAARMPRSGRPTRAWPRSPSPAPTCASISLDDRVSSGTATCSTRSPARIDLMVANLPYLPRRGGEPATRNSPASPRRPSSPRATASTPIAPLSPPAGSA